MSPGNSTVFSFLSCRSAMALVAAAALTSSLLARSAAGPARQDTSAAAPEITSVKPASVTPGSKLNVKIAGKHFASGARAGFQNPGIHVIAVEVKKPSEMEVRIHVDSNTATGSTTLYVSNPDDAEAEADFSVATGTAVAEGEDPSDATAKSKPAASTDSAGAASAQQFQVINLGDIGGLLKGTGTKPRGTLSISKGRLIYTEAGEQIFSVPNSDVREIDENQAFGISTGTFHVILNSGKTYNFAAASLRPADGQAIISSLRQALK